MFVCIPAIRFTQIPSSPVHPNERKERNLYSVGIKDDSNKKKIGLLGALKFFYTAPVTKFLGNLVSFRMSSKLVTRYLSSISDI